MGAMGWRPRTLKEATWARVDTLRTGAALAYMFTRRRRWLVAVAVLGGLVPDSWAPRSGHTLPVDSERVA